MTEAQVRGIVCEEIRLLLRVMANYPPVDAAAAAKAVRLSVEFGPAPDFTPTIRRT